jgi:hypothetical protein
MYFFSGSSLSRASIDFSYLHCVSFDPALIGVDLHCENNPSTQDQPCQSRDGSRPEGKDPFIFEYPGCANKTVLVLFPCFN